MKQRILIAEGEPAYRRQCEAAFASEGYDVTVAESKSEVLRRLELDRPDALILDLQLPGGGIEALCEIREQAEELPIVLTYPSHLTDESFLVWCADEYVQESPDLSALRKAVRELLSARLLSCAE